MADGAPEQDEEVGERTPRQHEETASLTNPDPPAPGGRSLTQAVVTALILVAIMGGAFALGVAAFFVLVCVVVLMALFELLDAVTRRGQKPSIPLGLAGGLGMLVLAYVERPAAFAVVLAAVLVLGFLWSLRPTRGRSPTSDVAWTLLAVAWVGGGGAGATSILVLDPGGLHLLVGYVLLVALGDITAYFVGTALGRHKMAPSISPGKSWEGFAGSLFGSLLGGLAVAALLDELQLVQGLTMGAIAGLIAPVGDLVESLAKREIGIKDSGRILPGHGGFLDRLDAILFAAPAVYLYLLFVVF